MHQEKSVSIRQYYNYGNEFLLLPEFTQSVLSINPRQYKQFVKNELLLEADFEGHPYVPKRSISSYLETTSLILEEVSCDQI